MDHRKNKLAASVAALMLGVSGGAYSVQIDTFNGGGSVLDCQADSDGDSEGNVTFFTPDPIIGCIKTFDALVQHEMTFYLNENSIPGTPFSTVEGALFETVVNNTGTAWTDYHLSVNGLPPGIFTEGLDLPDVNFYEGFVNVANPDLFSDVQVSDNMVWLFFDEPFASGESFDLFGAFFAEGFDEGLFDAGFTEGFGISQHPSVAGVPEPATLGLFGAGLGAAAGLASLRRRKERKKRQS